MRCWLDLACPWMLPSRLCLSAGVKFGGFSGNVRVTPLPRASVDLLASLRWARLLMTGDRTGIGLQVQDRHGCLSAGAFSLDFTLPRCAILGEKRQPQRHQYPSASPSIPTTSREHRPLHGDMGMAGEMSLRLGRRWMALPTIPP